MTDEQIIKALKYCYRDMNYVKCNSNCPMYEYCESDEENEMNICGLAFELINRQKAEIEGLYKINKSSEEEIHELRTELLKRQNLEESFCRTINQFDKRLAKTVKAERAETIKEFAERLKSLAYTSKDWSHGEHPYVVEVEDIDNVVDEMTEGKDNARKID